MKETKHTFIPLSCSLNHEGGKNKKKKKKSGGFSPLVYSQNGSISRVSLEHGTYLSPHHIVGFYLS
jgi:hypothetical protein